MLAGNTQAEQMSGKTKQLETKKGTSEIRGRVCEKKG